MNNLNTIRVMGEAESFSGTTQTPGAMLIPLQSVPMAKPLSYEFRVAEHTDVSGNIVKVGLQVRIWEHDQYGVGQLFHDWKDVERVKVSA